MPKPIPTPYTTTQTPTLAEQADVHAVYEAIAPHFSSTRYKPWPLVSAFLQSLPPHSIGLDSGAGNGKYVPLASEQGRMCWALDMSWGLLSDARRSLSEAARPAGQRTEAEPSVERRTGPVECLRGELGYDGWRAGVFDWAISIAAIHHLTTPQRRVQSVQALMRCLVNRTSADELPRSRFMIYVWAYEQGEGSKRKMGKRAARTDDGGADAVAERTEAMTMAAPDERGKQTITPDDEQDEIVQDVLVPWVMQPARSASKRQPGQPRARRKKQPAAVTTPPGDVGPGGDVEASNGKPETAGESAVTPVEEPKVYHRYYHLFLRGELRDLVVTAAREDGYEVLPDPVGGELGTGAPDVTATGEASGKWMRVLREGWEADNWWIECEVGMGPV